MEQNKGHTRQLDIVKPSELDFPIIVIGAGGIGSWATLALAKMGCSDISVIDFDKVEAHNVPSQLFKPEQIGMDKVEALAQNVKDLTGLSVFGFPSRWSVFNEDFEQTDVIICAVDSMDTRIKIWDSLKAAKIGRKFECFIDARMGGELVRIFSVDPYSWRSIKYYENHLYPSSKAYKEQCTGRSIVYNTFMSGAIIASLVKKYAKKEPLKNEFVFDIKNLQIV